AVSESFIGVFPSVQRTRPAVVNIHSQKVNPNVGALPGATGAASRLSGMGTGVVVDPRGYILTNHHVIEDVTQLRVTLVDGSTYAAEIAARDPQTDLALLSIKPNGSLPVMPLGTSEDLMVGETVIAIGNAFGYEHTTTVGYVSELHRDVKLSEEQSYRNLIQTDAAINPGNSGGPLVNLDGEMIGLNVAIRAGAQNIGFAIPADEVKQILAKLLSTQRLRRTWHGLSCRTADLADKSPARVVVKRVDPGSPGEAAGLQVDDRLVAISQAPLAAAYDLERALLDRNPGERVDVTYLRDGEERTARLTVGGAPVRVADAASTVWRRMGLRLDETANTAPEVRRISSAQLGGGLKVTDVAKRGPAESAGVKPGDIFVGLDDRETSTLGHLEIMLKQPAANAGGPVKFWLVRAGKLHYGMMNVLAED
ncbi:MAG TPA: trypsin-like peptidase domain-containing protein, partial [Planctomycetia bacterium]|nr:trypsin-like peptidase domain-containing protein [Planctomycetia bacterium]